MNIQKAYLVGTHRYWSQAGNPAEIIGVVIVTPDDLPPRPCYQVRFEDGQEDFMPLYNRQHFEIISEEDVRAGRIPEVTH